MNSTGSHLSQATHALRRIDGTRSHLSQATYLGSGQTLR